MSPPLFAVGQSVSVALSKRHRLPVGPYLIVGAMPNDGGPTLYRIKGELEKFERVIEEMHLAPA